MWNIIVRRVSAFFLLGLISAVRCPAEEVRFGFWDEAQLARRPAAEREAIIAWQAKGFSAGAYAFLHGLGETAPWEGDGSHISREHFHCPDVLNDGKELLFFKDTSRLQTFDCSRINLTDADGADAGCIWFTFAPSAMQAEASMANHFGIYSSLNPISLSKHFMLERTGPGDLILWQKSKTPMAEDGTFLREGCPRVFFIRANVLVDIELRDGTAHDIFALAAILDEALLEALEHPEERKAQEETFVPTEPDATP